MPCLFLQGTSRAPWTRWRGSASRGRGGSRCPPCPPAAAPAPAARPPACSSSSVGLRRAPAVPSRPCACGRCPERAPTARGAAPAEHQVPEDGDRVCVRPCRGGSAPGSRRPATPGAAAATVSHNASEIPLGSRTTGCCRCPTAEEPRDKSCCPGAWGGPRLLARGAAEAGPLPPCRPVRPRVRAVCVAVSAVSS